MIDGPEDDLESHGGKSRPRAKKSKIHINTYLKGVLFSLFMLMMTVSVWLWQILTERGGLWAVDEEVEEG